MSHGGEPVSDQAPEVAAEKRDVKWRPVLMFLGVVSVVLIVLHIIVTVMFISMAKRTRYATKPFGKPAPEMAQQLQSLRRHEDQVLHGYAWISREDRVVRVPIERAIDLTAQAYGEKEP